MENKTNLLVQSSGRPFRSGGSALLPWPNSRPARRAITPRRVVAINSLKAGVCFEFISGSPYLKLFVESVCYETTQSRGAGILSESMLRRRPLRFLVKLYCAWVSFTLPQASAWSRKPVRSERRVSGMASSPGAPAPLSPALRRIDLDSLYVLMVAPTGSA